FALIALAEIFYGPTASTLIGDIASEHLRGVYFALDSQCWAIGFLIGPALGGWALDHPDVLGTNIWLALVSSSAIVGTILLLLRGQLAKDIPSSEKAL
ncbi:MAG: MFS transporter, partial [Cyanobacteria bacterium P01_F01_bin.86]